MTKSPASMSHERSWRDQGARYVFKNIQGHAGTMQDGWVIPRAGHRCVLWGQRGQNEDQAVEVMEKISIQF